MKGRPEDWIPVLDQLLAGDHLAFLNVNGLITGYLARLRAYDFRDEWDDLRQEVVLSVVATAKAGKLRDPKAFLAYVATITRNKVFDRLKARVRRREKETIPWENEMAHCAGMLERSSEDRQFATELWAAIGSLPPEQQVIVEGVYRHGKTYEAVCSDNGVPLGTMKRRLREGLLALRKRFGDALHDG